MNEEQFANLAAQGYNRIPLHREVLADFDTPLSVYLKLADAPYSYLFESVQGGEKWGRFSFIGLPAATVIRLRGHRVTVTRDDALVEDIESPDPLAWIDAFQRRFRVPETGEGLPRFAGGLVGYFGYDTVRYIEPRLAEARHPDPLEMPDILLMLSEDVVVFDNLSGKLFVITQVDPSRPNAWDSGQRRLDEIVAQLRGGQPSYTVDGAISRRVSEVDFTSGFSRPAFETAVDRIKRYIVDGDAMQVVLSQRLSIPFAASPLDLYRALRTLNPSPYMFFVNLGDSHNVGSIPSRREINTRVWLRAPATATVSNCR